MQYPISVGMSRETLKNLRQRYQIYKGQRLKQEGYKMILVDSYAKQTMIARKICTISRIELKTIDKYD